MQPSSPPMPTRSSFMSNYLQAKHIKIVTWKDAKLLNARCDLLS